MTLDQDIETVRKACEFGGRISVATGPHLAALAALDRIQAENERLSTELRKMESVDLDDLLNALRKTFDDWVEAVRAALEPKETQ